MKKIVVFMSLVLAMGNIYAAQDEKMKEAIETIKEIFLSQYKQERCFDYQDKLTIPCMTFQSFAVYKNCIQEYLICARTNIIPVSGYIQCSTKSIDDVREEAKKFLRLSSKNIHSSDDKLLIKAYASLLFESVRAAEKHVQNDPLHKAVIEHHTEAAKADKIEQVTKAAAIIAGDDTLDNPLIDTKSQQAKKRAKQREARKKAASAGAAAADHSSDNEAADDDQEVEKLLAAMALRSGKQKNKLKVTLDMEIVTKNDTKE